MSQLPAPRPANELDEEFWQHCAERRLAFQRCDGCGRWRHPPRLACAACGSDEWHWEAATGNGRVWSWTVSHRPAHPAFADEVPYVTAIVELDEGIRIVSAVRDVAPEDLRLDLPLAVDFEEREGGAWVHVFRALGDVPA